MKCPNHVYLNESVSFELLEYYECPSCSRPLIEHERELRDDIPVGTIYVVDPQVVTTL